MGNGVLGTDSGKVEAIKSMPVPRSVKEVC